MKIIQTISDKLLNIAYEPIENRVQTLENLKTEILDVGVPEMNDEQYNLMIDILDDLISETKTQISLMPERKVVEPQKPVVAQVSQTTRKTRASKKTPKVESEDLSFIDDALNLF